MTATVESAPSPVAPQSPHGDIRAETHIAVANAFGEGSWSEAEYILDHESGFSPVSVNSSSGACGLGQALPCGKMPCGLSYADADVQCQIHWVMGYFRDHWGTVGAAYYHELAYGWY